ncbi:MAG: putative dsRNA-binding protein, partial [Terrimicrobiaceae bacterium]
SKNFVCRVMWNGAELGRGAGHSKKEAQVAAAEIALSERVWEKDRRRKAQAA